MRLNRTFLRNFAGDHSRTIALCSFFVHRYHIGDDSLSMLSSFMNYIAVKMKGVAVCYDSLDKYYEEWKLYGAEKKIDVSNEERSNIEERLSVFIGLKDCESLSSENKKILESFLVPNDSAMFYVYVASIDLFYMFIQCWRNHEVRQCAELGHISKFDRHVFNIFSLEFTNYPKILKKLIVFFGRTTPRINKCVEYINQLYSLEGFWFDENSSIEKVSIMNILAEIYECIHPFNESILYIIHSMNAGNIKTDKLFDNYLIQYMYITLAKKSQEMKAKYEVELNQVARKQNIVYNVKSYWPLPENYFELTSAEKKDFFGDVKDVIKDVDAFEKFINYLASEGYIEDDDLTKRMIAFVLTGKGKPNENVNKIEWKTGRNELAYMCQQIYAFNGKFQRIPTFFNYENKEKKLTANYADNASANFKHKMKQLFPGLGIK